MNWKFDFSPETRAEFVVSDCPQHDKGLNIPMHEDQVHLWKTHT